MKDEDGARVHLVSPHGQLGGWGLARVSIVSGASIVDRADRKVALALDGRIVCCLLLEPTSVQQLACL